MTTASPSRAAPIPASGGVLGWMRANLFNSIGGGIVTLITLYVLVSLLVPFIRWALIDAVWHAENARACHAAGTGACWAFIGEKWRFILFGRYPYEEQWRSALVSVLFFLLVGATCVPSLWRRELLYVWAAVIILNAWLMMGGMLGLSPVPTDLWSGLPLTLILALFSMILGFPLAVLLALGRRSSLPIIRAFSTGFIELMRGVPLITVLFMASLMIPLFLPSGVSIDKTLRALVGITLFLAA
jgi:general L-amino acid transport system permease protein